MSEHEQIRELLPLAASGDLSSDEMRRVCEHLTSCAACRQAGEDLSALEDALRSLPTPQPRAELVVRVSDLVGPHLARKRARCREAAVIAPLIAASWIMAFATAPLVPAAGKWILTGWYVPGGGYGSALATYSILGFLLACVSALAVGKRASAMGRAK